MDQSSIYEENRLSYRDYDFSVYAWIYDDTNLLNPTEPTIKNYGLEKYVWSVQLCDGRDLNDLEVKVERALKELESVHSFDRRPASEVFGRHGEVLFDHTWSPNFYSTDLSSLGTETLCGRVVNVRFVLENDKAGTIRACPRLIEIKPKDFEPLDQ
jgi:hypothetical protein